VIPHSVTLREFGPAAIVPLADWEASGLAEAADLLASRRVLRVRSSGPYRLLEPGQFVGRFRLAGRSIAVEPRLPRLFDALRNFVARPPAKVVPAMDAMRSAATPHAMHPALAFAKALEEAVRDGLPAEYHRTEITTSRPRGRLLVSETLRTLHARGLYHLARSAVQTRRYDPRLCRIVRASTASLFAARDVPTRAAAALDRLSPLTEEGGATSVTAAAELVRELRAEYADRPPVLELLRVAGEVLAEATVVWSLDQPLAGGDCRFCDMVSLWEHAIRAALELACGEGERASLHPFRQVHMRLFGDGGPTIDPDLAIYNQGTVVAVVDAKYSVTKTWVADDVYQIAAYVRRTSAPLGALVYVSPGEKWFERVGHDANGAQILALGVPAEDAYAGLIDAAGRIKAEIPARA
jgi:hypothetical protein